MLRHKKEIDGVKAIHAMIVEISWKNSPFFKVSQISQYTLLSAAALYHLKEK